MTQLVTAVLSLLACIPASWSLVTVPATLTALEGRSIAAPCHYDLSLTAHVKYWCRGTFKDLCSMLARTDKDSSDPGVSIVDDPTQQVFTVTMADLREDQSGWYHCGVEHGGIWTADSTAAVYLSVVHGMSVVDSTVSGEEGGSLDVDCLYSKRYRDINKQWCRSGNQGSCVSAGSDGRYNGLSVTITDDRVGAFTVTVSGLQMTDAGWYWCRAGVQQTAVQVVVTPRPSTTPRLSTSTPTLTPSPEHSATDSLLAHRHVLEAVVMCASVLLIFGMVVLARQLWKKHQKACRLRQAEELRATLSMCRDGMEEDSLMFLNLDSQKAGNR